VGGGEIALNQGPDPDEAVRLGAAGAAIGRALGDIDLEMVGQALEGLARVNVGDVDDGMQLLDEAAAAAFAEGVAGRSRPKLEEAVERYEQAGLPYECAQARLALARMLDALDRAALAGEERAAADRTLRKLGARRHELLSPRELEVLRLVATGFRDAEIAARLVLSEHTVHRHVANLRQKLGAGSRAAAVGAATKLGLL
jgi:DNA-binding NarL/FixJ family response regulator